MRRLVLLMLALPTSAAAQAGSEIYLAELQNTDGVVQVTTPVNITNRPGYDNQPFFSLNGRSLYFTSLDNAQQAEIFQYDLARRMHTRITDNYESEYSPTPLPDGGISVIRVERDSTQRLWKVRKNRFTVLLPNVKPVGYHAWIDDEWLALFVLGSPNTLRIARVGHDTARIAAYNIGRALLNIPGTRNISFVQPDANGDMHLRIFHSLTGKIEDAGPLPPGGEYHVYLKSGSVLATAGTKLYQRLGTEWRVVADFSAIGQVSRIAISPDEKRIALTFLEPT